MIINDVKVFYYNNINKYFTINSGLKMVGENMVNDFKRLIPECGILSQDKVSIKLVDE